MRVRRADRTHFIQDNIDAAFRQLPRGLGTGQTSSGDYDAGLQTSILICTRSETIRDGCHSLIVILSPVPLGISALIALTSLSIRPTLVPVRQRTLRGVPGCAPAEPRIPDDATKRLHGPSSVSRGWLQGGSCPNSRRTREGPTSHASPSAPQVRSRACKPRAWKVRAHGRPSSWHPCAPRPPRLAPESSPLWAHRPRPARAICRSE